MGERLPVIRALRSRRRALGLSMRAASERAGWAPHVVASWERGDRCPSLERACGYAAILGLRVVVVAGARVPVPIEACAHDARRPTVLRQLRASRLARDLTVGHVAALMGARGPTLTAWENGERRLQLDQAHAYASALGLALAVEPISPSVTALVEAGGRPRVGRPG